MTTLKTIKDKGTKLLRRGFRLLGIAIVAVTLSIAIKGCADNIRQDKQDALLLEKIDERTQMLMQSQQRCADIEKRLGVLEGKLNEVGARLSK